MIEKIYSRKRFISPKKLNFKPNKNYKKTKNMVKVIAVFAIAFTVLFTLINGINPMFNKLAEEKARGIATEIVNSETTSTLENIGYETLVKVEKDDTDNIQMIRVDVVKVNNLASNIAYNIQIELNKKTSERISIPFGSISGIKYLSGFGPKINIKINPVRKR